jgi:beta-galactosidase
MLGMRHAQLAIGLLAVTLNGCLPAGTSGTLEPTLAMVDVAGLEVAMQNGIPVPTFDWQPRPRLDLDGVWRVEGAELDPELTMTARDSSLAEIEDEAGERHLPGFDDTDWASVAVPGTVNSPPDGREGGAWYRHSFDVPREWVGRSVTIRFASANYVADVWLNGTWLGYHEGGATPFAFQAGESLQPARSNVVAVRVHTIPRGTRNDVVPWGATDWWNYGGLTGSVWLEAAPAIHVARADVVPHLDAVEVEVLISHAAALGGRPPQDPGAPGGDGVPAILRGTIHAASVDPDNLLELDPRELVTDLADPLLVVEEEVTLPGAGVVNGARLSLQFGDADRWSPAVPALYVLHVQLLRPQPSPDPREGRLRDELWTTFGIRHLAVDPAGPSVLLNGERSFFRGVGLHAETLTFDIGADLVSGTPAQRPEDVLSDLRDAAAVGADLVRTGHQPADPLLLLLADRLGFAVWEEIPLYHTTPLVFERSMGRGIPQQMLREMALRDMNRPSVLFHGFANESTGDDERTDAMAELHDVDRAIDGTRLTGQAAYGWRPDDPTHAALDVAGMTSYHGVFYGDDPAADTRRALIQAHEAYPDKPIMVLEFGRWADLPADEERQRAIFDETYGAIEAHRGDEFGGFVAGATWWTLHDFATPLAGIGLEQFGLFRPDGSLRPAGQAVTANFAAPAGRGDALSLDPELLRPRVRPERLLGDWSLLTYVGYALGLSIGALAVLLLILTRHGERRIGEAP